MRPFAIIAALADNRVIGKGNKLPWNETEDLAYFKQVTMEHPVIMGKNTHKSIGRILPGRRNIVVSRSDKGIANNVWHATSLDSALDVCPGDEGMPFVIGGAQLYAEAIEHQLCSMLYITTIALKVEGDAYFPQFAVSEWEEVHCLHRGKCTFRTFVRA